MKTVSVYQYQSAREFLKDSVAELKRKDSDFSVRKFCKRSGLGSHALLIMLLNGKRKPTLKQVPAFTTAFNLSSIERMYLQTLIQLDNAKTDEERDLYRLWLHDLNPNPEQKTVEFEQYHVIANWIHMAILTLAKIEGAKITAENIFSLSSGRLSQSEIRQAIVRLLDLGLLIEKDGNLKPTQNWVRTRDDLASKGAREYHKQVLKLANDAIEEQNVSIREYQSFALTIPEGKIPLAKDMIRKFRNQFVLSMESEPGTDVYQCNLQFFRLLERPQTMVSAVNESKSSNTNKTKMKEVQL